MKMSLYSKAGNIDILSLETLAAPFGEEWEFKRETEKNDEWFCASGRKSKSFTSNVIDEISLQNGIKGTLISAYEEDP